MMGILMNWRQQYHYYYYYYYEAGAQLIRKDDGMQTIEGLFGQKYEFLQIGNLIVNVILIWLAAYLFCTSGLALHQWCL